MNNNSRTIEYSLSLKALSLEAKERIDRICCAFEEAWRNGGRPQAEAFLGDTTGGERSALLVELLLLDVDYRQRGGEQPVAEEYRLRLPQNENVIDTVFRRSRRAEATLLPPAPLRDEMLGSRVGPYTLLSVLGEGGFGIVYLAEQEQPIRRRVALKILKAGMDTKQVLARFDAERHTLALMDHANIARVFDAGTTDSGRSYFVMELVRGEPITAYCDSRKLTVKQRLGLFLTVCQAVQHAHQKGIIHRDIKPTNILVTVVDDQPLPKIIDFGLAKALARPPSEESIFTEQGQLLGTPEYMSPEQAGMAVADIDTRSDIYSLGVLLYELLTGTLPFDRRMLRQAGFEEICRIIREVEPPRPSARVSTLDGESQALAKNRQVDPNSLHRQLRQELDWIVMKALEKERTRRYAAAIALAEDIEHYLAHEPVHAGPPGNWYRARKFLRRFRLPLTIAAGFVALLVVIAAGAVREYYREAKLSSDAEIARRQAENETGFAQQQKRRAEEQEGRANEQQRQAKQQERRAKQQAALAKQQAALAKEKERLAKEEKIEAQSQRDAATRNLYLAQMRLAQQDLGAGQVPRLHAMLDSYLPRPGQPDLRGWEWYYLLSQCHGELLTFRGHEGWVIAVAWSPDGRQIASSADQTIKIWDPASGKEVRTLRGYSDTVRWLAWSADGGQLASAGGDSIKVWSVSTGQELRTLVGHSSPITSAAWSPDLGRFAAGSNDGRIRILHAGTGEEIRVLNVHKHTANQESVPLSWSPDGRQLASASDRAVKIWDVSTGEELRTLRGHKDGISNVVWSPNGRRLAAGSWGIFEVKVWDATTGHELVSLKGLDSTVYGLAWSPDGRLLASGGYSGTVKISDAASGELVGTLRGHTLTAQAVAWSPNGQRVASGSADGTVRIWDATAEPEARALRGQVRSVSAVAWSPDGRQLLGGGGAGRLEVWDVRTGQSARTWSAHSGPCSTVAWSPDGKRIASASEEGRIKVWNAGTAQEFCTLEGHQGLLRALVWSPDGRWLASGGDDATIRIWDVAAAKEIRALRGYAHPVHGLAWSPDGGRIASGADWAWHEPVKIWEAASGQSVLALQHADDVAHVRGPVAWSPDGRWVASAGRVIEVWNAADGQLTFRLYGHNGTVNALAWHPHGNRLASAAEEHTIKIWDLDSRQEILTLRPHTAWAAASLVWSPDGTRLAAVNKDEVRIWDASVGYRMAAGPDYGYDQSCRLASEGHNDEAASVLKKLVDESPDTPAYKVKLAEMFQASGTAFLRRGEFDKAIAQFTKVIRLDPKNAAAYANRGETYGHKGELDKRIADDSEAIRLDPKNAAAYDNRGSAHREKGENDKAIADYTEAIRLNPNYVVAYHNRALAYAGKGENDKAITDDCEVIRLDPNGAWSYYERALVYARKGENDKAIADYTEAVRLDPNYIEAYYNRALAYGRKGEGDKAIADYTEAIRLNPKHVWSYYERALAYGSKGEDDKAIAGFNEAIRLKPDYIEAYYQRALAYAGKGENDKAIADWSEVVRLDPRSYSHRLDRGQAYFDKGLLNEARADFSEALRLEPADPGGASALLADLALEKGDYDHAIADALKAVQRAPEQAGFWYARVLAPLAAGRLGDYRKALAEMVERLGKGEDPNAARLVTWACVVKPDSGADWPRVLALAERAARQERGSSACLAPLGAVLYRAGSYGRAIQRLSEADRLLRDPSEIAVNSPAYTWFFLAMANHRLGHAAEAKKWLDKAGQWSDLAARELQAGLLPRQYYSWKRRLALRLLREEAETLLGAKSAPLADPPPPQSAESHRKRGRVLAGKGDLGGAISAYRAAVRLFQATGRARRAEAACNEALTILKTLVEKHPDASQNESDLATTFYDLGNLYQDSGRSKEAGAAFREALAIRKNLVAKHPDAPEYQTKLATSYYNYYNLGIRYRAAFGAKEAETAYKEALAIGKILVKKDPEVPQYQDVQARCYHNLGVLYQDTGRTKEAGAAYKEAFAVWKILAEKHPDVPGYQDWLADMHGHLGINNLATGRAKEAESAYKEALAIQKIVVEKHPESREHQNGLATCYHNLGLLYHDTGRTKEAAAAYKEAFAIWKILAEKLADVPGYRDRLADMHGHLGTNYMAAGRAKEAESAYLQALAIQKTVVEKHPEAPEYQSDLADCYHNLGVLYRDTGRAKEAETAFKEALSIGKILVEKHPEAPNYQYDLAKSHGDMGILYRDTGRTKEAETAFKEAFAIHRILVEEDPEVLKYRCRLAGIYNSLGILYKHTGQAKEAEAACESALAILEPLNESTHDFVECEAVLSAVYYNLACFRAISSAEKNGDAGRAADQSATSADALMKTALEYLQQACDHGYFDNPKSLEPMKRESDLDGLRDRPAYKTLLEKIAARSNPDSKQIP